MTNPIKKIVEIVEKSTNRKIKPKNNATKISGLEPLKIESEKNAFSVLGDMDMLGDLSSKQSSEHEIIRSRRILGSVVDELNLTQIIKPRYPALLESVIHQGDTLSYFENLIPVKYGRYGEFVKVSEFSVQKNILKRNFIIKAKSKEDYELLTDDGLLLMKGKVGESSKEQEIKIKLENMQSHVGGEFIVQLLSRQEAISKLFNNLKVTYGDRRSKDIIRLSLEHADKKLATQIINAVAHHYIKYKIESQTLVAEKTLAFIEDQLSKFSGDMVFSNEIYKMLIKKTHQLKVMKAGEIGGVRVVDWAVIAEKPVKPNKGLVLMGCFIAGLFLGAIVALVRAFMDKKIYDPNTIEYNLDLPVYATIPLSTEQIKLNRQALRLSSDSNMPLGVLYKEHPDDSAIEAMRFLRTNLERGELEIKHHGVVMITGATPNAGKSFMSVNLACLYAELGKKVLLLDADVRKGVQHKFFNCSNKNGLSDYLSGSVDFSDIIKNTETKDLDIITSGHRPHNSSVLMSSYKLKELFAEVKNHYDIVIVDTPPVLSITDATIIAKHSDRLMVVVRSGVTTLDEVSICWRKLTQSGKKPTGLIMSGYTPGRFGYGYNLPYAAY